MLSGVTVQQLQIFLMIARAGSLSAAARRLQMTPAAVSLALRQLEQQLGLPLLQRTTRRQALTPAGERLLAQGQPALGALQQAFDEVQALGDTPCGRVSITLPRFVYRWLLQPCYAEFCARYPQIVLEIHVHDGTVALLSEGIDVGIRFEDLLDEEVVARPLTEPLLEALFASPAYLARYGEPTTPDELAQHRQVQYRFQTSRQLAPLLLQWQGRLQGQALTPALIVNDTDALIDAVKQDLGVGHLLLLAVEAELASGALQPVMVANWRQVSPLYLYYLKESQKACRVRVLVEFLLEKARERGA